MIVYQEDLVINMGGGPEFKNITNLLCGVVIRSELTNGRLVVSVIGSAASVTAMKYDPQTIEDFSAAMERIAPAGGEYAHNSVSGDGNGHAHVLSAFIGPDVSFPIHNGLLRLGKLQQVVLINHDVNPRARTLVVTLTGKCRELAHGRHCSS